MNDIRSRLREADKVPVPDLWPEIRSRGPSRSFVDQGRSRLGVLVASLVAAFVGILLLARAFLGGSPTALPGNLRTPQLTSRPGNPIPVSNGLIAFVRTDPASVLAGDGAAVKASLYVVNPDGSGLTELVRSVAPFSAAAWSPDGSRLAVGTAVGDASGISIANADGSGLRLIAACTAGQDCGYNAPAWSPDGSRLAFLGDGVWVINADGSQLRPLVKDFAPQGAPAWSPDGREIAVSGGFFQADGRVQAIQINFFDVTTGKRLRSVRPEGLDLFGRISWSPDSQWLAFDAAGPGGSLKGAGIYLMRPDGSSLRTLTSWSCGLNICRAGQPAWSPDGKEIVFTRGGDEQGSDGTDGNLFTIDVKSGRVRQLTSGAGLDCCASWQPRRGAATSDSTKKSILDIIIPGYRSCVENPCETVAVTSELLDQLLGQPIVYPRDVGLPECTSTPSPGFSSAEEAAREVHGHVGDAPVCMVHPRDSAVVVAMPASEAARFRGDFKCEGTLTAPCGVPE
jgi:TolB protein